MDQTIDLDAQRLTLAAALMGLARRHCGRRISSTSNAADLLILARNLQQDVATIEHVQGFHFEPPYPGATIGPEAVADVYRLVLACTVFKDGKELGVAFTTLIPGHPPRVSIAPVGALIPVGWQPLGSGV